MAGTTSTVIGETDRAGLRRLAVGAGTGLAGGIAGLVLPIALLLLAEFGWGPLSRFDSYFVEVTSVLLLAGSILLLLSLFIYRRGFAVLRSVDRRFVAASVLCLLGSIGFLLLVVSALAILSGSDAVALCLHRPPTQAFACLRADSPLGAYSALVGFLLAWLGGLGLLLGVASAGRRYHIGRLSVGAALYGLVLLDLIGPFVGLFWPLGGAQNLLFAAPVLLLVAPAFVWSGSRAVLRAAPAGHR